MRRWSFLTAAAVLFGIGLACQTVTDVISPAQEGTVDVAVGENPTATQMERAANPTPTMIPTVEPTACPATAYVEQSPAFGGEMYVEAGEEVALRWQLVNSGPCEWTPEYRLVEVEGAEELNVEPIGLNQRVPEGETVAMEVSLTAPSDSASYTLVFQLESPSGAPVSIAESESPELSVNIHVVEPGEVVAVQGLQVPPPSCIDLDQLRRSSCERGLVDILYVSDLIAGIHQISPLDGTVLRPYGATPPSSVETCAEFAMTEEEVGLREGWVYCFRTGAGRLGWFQLQSASGVVSMDVTVAY
ncbi:MAG: NBR1-Ig-like domain-containing protein [Anaerolineales bacterium]|nr:NBR1-Ig-like domain-containing protein [Anaerolineales bacterium]